MPVPEEFKLTNKVALIAGDGAGSTPILATSLAEAGARVFVLSSNRQAMHKAVQAVVRQGGQVLGSLYDDLTEESIRRELVTLLAHWQRVDILVNNFRTEFAKPFEKVSLAEWETLMDRNVKSVFLLCRVVGERMFQQGGGRIVNIVSNLAERGMANSAVFCASQGAVIQLTRALAQEWGRHNIRVNAVGTGWFSLEEIPPEEAQKELLVRYIPLRRKGHPRDIAPLVVYLASDACDYTTGQVIYIDGGLMARA